MTRVVLLLLALALAGCGGDERGRGEATLWVTRDRGHTVVFEGRVPAGLTALQALDRELEVDTRYGGRFVQAIEGIVGDPAEQRDWFWYVNGIEGDRSATEYRLRDGDVEWWDFRSWKSQLRVPVVVGAFPEPFLHGFDGKRRRAVVRYATPRQRAAARAVGAVIGADSVERFDGALPDDANVFLYGEGRDRFDAQLDGGTDGRVIFRFGGDGRRLAANPELAKMRYEGLRE